jgi:hypothetical protein
MNQHLVNASEGAGAVLSGAADFPLDVLKYSGVGATRLAELAGLVSKETANRNASQIREFANNPPFIPENIQNYRNYLAGKHPASRFIGEVGTGGLAALGRTTGVKNLTSFFTPGVSASLAAMGSNALSEGAVEPVMDIMLGLSQQQKQQPTR